MMADKKEERPSDQEIVQQFNMMKQELNQIAQKIGELEQEKEEHDLVISTIKPLDKGRGVLVEKDIETVLPMVEQNLAGIQQLMQQLGVQYKKKEDQSLEFQKKYNIKIKQQ